MPSTRSRGSTHYKPIGAYGIVGDLETVALVSTDATVDFMCFPRFDSPTVFATLLDRKRGGSFQLAPLLKTARRKQLYLPDSNILLTRFLSDEGMAEVSDFMTIEAVTGQRALVRRAKCVRGNVRFRMDCAPRFDYGRVENRVQKRKHEVVFLSRGADKTALRLRSQIPLRATNSSARAEFTLRSNESVSFVLEDGRLRDSAAAGPNFVADAFKETLNFWRDWLRHSQYRGRWRETVNRSALLLKLLTSARFGSLVAAPTFGLPEQIGGVRNWDYRYTWVRDASFTVYALMRLGYTEEATAFIRWVEARCAELKPGLPLQVMYSIDGRQDLTETTLDHFEGYRHSRPVRVGNAAFDQHQLDIYGELMDSVYIYNKFGEPISDDFWRHLSRLIDWVCDHWQRPDHGIWEVRGGPREFLYSRLMCWVAVDRGLRLAQKRSFPAPVLRWQRVRDRIYTDIYENFWDPELQTFVQYKGSKTVDAAALLMPLMKFIGPNDPRWRTTLKCINETLRDDSLVYRYDVVKGAYSGFRGREGTFSICSFWNVECLARAGDLRQARFLFEKTLGYANHLGLFSEEIGLNGEQLGNFPQAFTHLGLISAAWYLDRALDKSAC